MSPGAILVGVGLLLLSVFAIASPRRRSPGPMQALWAPTPRPVAQASAAELYAQRDGAYAALADLDFDRGLGNVNEDDYQTVRARLLTQAVAALRGLDAADAEIESQVEALVRKRRAALQANDRPQSAERTARPGFTNGKASVARFCVGCGAALSLADRFCGKCGASVDERCPQCGAAVQSKDRFCVDCGTSLAGDVALP